MGGQVTYFLYRYSNGVNIRLYTTTAGTRVGQGVLGKVQCMGKGSRIFQLMFLLSLVLMHLMDFFNKTIH